MHLKIDSKILFDVSALPTSSPSPFGSIQQNNGKHEQPGYRFVIQIQTQKGVLSVLIAHSRHIMVIAAAVKFNKALDRTHSLSAVFPDNNIGHLKELLPAPLGKRSVSYMQEFSPSRRIFPAAPLSLTSRGRLPASYSITKVRTPYFPFGDCNSTASPSYISRQPSGNSALKPRTEHHSRKRGVFLRSQKFRQDCWRIPNSTRAKTASDI